MPKVSDLRRWSAGKETIDEFVMVNLGMARPDIKHILEISLLDSEGLNSCT